MSEDSYHPTSAEAAHAALVQEHDDFYGRVEAPFSDVTAIGEHVAAEAMSIVVETSERQ